MESTTIHDIAKLSWNTGGYYLEEPEVNLCYIIERNIILDETEYIDKHSNNLTEWIDLFNHFVKMNFDDLPNELQNEIIDYVEVTMIREEKMKLLIGVTKNPYLL